MKATTVIPEAWSVLGLAGDAYDAFTTNKLVDDSPLRETVDALSRESDHQRKVIAELEIALARKASTEDCERARAEDAEAAALSASAACAAAIAELQAAHQRDRRELLARIEVIEAKRQRERNAKADAETKVEEVVGKIAVRAQEAAAQRERHHEMSVAGLRSLRTEIAAALATIGTTLEHHGASITHGEAERSALRSTTRTQETKLQQAKTMQQKAIKRCVPLTDFEAHLERAASEKRAIGIAFELSSEGRAALVHKCAQLAMVDLQHSEAIAALDARIEVVTTRLDELPSGAELSAKMHDLKYAEKRTLRRVDAEAKATQDALSGVVAVVAANKKRAASVKELANVREKLLENASVQNRKLSAALQKRIKTNSMSVGTAMSRLASVATTEEVDEKIAHSVAVLRVKLKELAGTVKSGHYGGGGSGSSPGTFSLDPHISQMQQRATDLLSVRSGGEEEEEEEEEEEASVSPRHVVEEGLEGVELASLDLGELRVQVHKALLVTSGRDLVASPRHADGGGGGHNFGSTAAAGGAKEETAATATTTAANIDDLLDAGLLHALIPTLHAKNALSAMKLRHMHGNEKALQEEHAGMPVEVIKEEVESRRQRLTTIATKADAMDVAGKIDTVALLEWLAEQKTARAAKRLRMGGAAKAKRLRARARAAASAADVSRGSGRAAAASAAQKKERAALRKRLNHQSELLQLYSKVADEVQRIFSNSSLTSNCLSCGSVVAAEGVVPIGMRRRLAADLAAEVEAAKSSKAKGRWRRAVRRVASRARPSTAGAAARRALPAVRRETGSGMTPW